MTGKKVREVIAEPPPYVLPSYTLADAVAIQALEKGTASEDQQKRALLWIVNNLALTYDSEYRSDERAHAFVAGRRFVGLQIVKMTKLNTANLAEAEKRNTP
jgi:hypothetical protein